MKKKAVSPLIAYILLIGMTVAMSVMVANYLIKQAKSTDFSSKEIELYCSEVSVDAQTQCWKELQSPDPINKALILNVTNRGYYNVSISSVVSVVRSDSITKNLIEGEQYIYASYLLNGQKNPDDILSPIGPQKKSYFEVVIDPTKNTELTITPAIMIGNKKAICNEKAFKLTIPSNINQCGVV